MNPPSPNVQVQLIADRNPWETLKEEFPRLHPVGAILLSLFLLIAAAYHPALQPPVWFSFFLLASCALVLIAIVRSPVVTLGCVAFLFGGYLLGGMGGADGPGLALATMAVSQIAALGIGAYLISVCRSYALLALPVGSYILALILCRDPLLSLLSLLIYPAAGILAHQTMNNRPRVGVIAMTSMIYGFCIAFGLSLWWCLTVGPTPLSELVDLIDSARTTVIADLLKDEELMETLQSYFASSSDPNAAWNFVVVSVEELFNLLPAFAIILCNLMAYLAQRLCICAFLGTGMKQLATPSARLFFLSVPSSLIFLLCALLSLFMRTATPFGAGVYNLWLILMPGMMLVGVHKFVADFRQGISKLWLAILVGSALFAPQVLLYCVAISGALHCLFRPLMARLILKNGWPPHDPSDDSHGGDSH